MASANAQQTPIANREEVRDEWLNRLSALLRNVETWAKELGWSTRLIDKQIDDSQVGSYRVPALLLQEATVRVLVEPIARSAPGVEGVVDLYLMPAYDDIASLYYCDGAWQVNHTAYTTPPAPTRPHPNSKPLSKEVLQKVLDEMKQHAA